MANRLITNIDLRDVCLETPFTRDVSVTVAATTTLAAGTLLSDGLTPDVFVVATDGGDPVTAVLQYELENTTGAPVDTPARPVLGGRVNASLLSFAGGGTPDETEFQALRKVGIHAVDVEELNKLNNPG